MFFIADLKTCHIFWAFEQLSSTITWRVMELHRARKIAQKHVLNSWFQSRSISYTGVKGFKKMFIWAQARLCHWVTQSQVDHTCIPLSPKQGCGKYMPEWRNIFHLPISLLMTLHSYSHLPYLDWQTCIPCLPNNKTYLIIGPSLVFENNFNISPTLKIHPSFKRKLRWNFGNRWPARHSRRWWNDCFWINFS